MKHWHPPADDLWAPPRYRRVGVDEVRAELPPASASRGYQISQLYSSAVGFGAVARRMVEARWSVDGEDAFSRRVLAEPTGRTSASPQIRVLEQRMAKPGEPGSYRLREVPPGVLRIIVGMDVQGDRVIWSAWGFGAAMRRGWLIDAGQVQSLDGTELAGVDALLDQSWLLHHDHPGRAFGGFAMRVTGAAIDSGYRTDEVYAAVSRLARAKKTIVAAKGWTPAAAAAVPVPWRIERWQPASRAARSSRPRSAIPEGVQGLLVNSNFWKSRLMARLGALQVSAAAISQEQHWTLPHNCPREVVRQLAAERLVEKMVRGRRSSLWELRPGIEDNHHLDCAVYAMATCHALRGESLKVAAGLLGADGRPAVVSTPAEWQSVASRPATGPRPDPLRPEPTGRELRGTAADPVLGRKDS